MPTTTEANTATNRKSGQGHGYKEMYSKSRRTALPPGVEAPDFTLRSTPDQWLTLSEFRGQPVVLAFYPADWSPVCGDQMALYNEILKDFHDLGAELIGISVDGAWCHAAFAHHRKLHFPLLADFEPKGDVARRYGVYRDKDGVSERALFVVDAEGKVYWSFVSPIGVNPGADGILSALEDLQKKTSNASNDRGKMINEAHLTVPYPERDHIQGTADAPVALLEYGDYECHVCGEAQPMLREIQRRLGDNLCFAFRHFPLANVHPHAEHAAEAAEACGEQGAFWPMHETLFANQDTLDDESLAQYAAALGLDETRVLQEVISNAHAHRIREDFRSGVRAGVNGTPCFFINGQRYDGARALEPLLAAISQPARVT